MWEPMNGRSPERAKVRQLEEEIRQREKKLREDRSSDPDDEHLSLPQAWLLIVAGALGVGGTGHLSSLQFEILLRTEKMAMMDPGLAIALAAQRGFQSLGSWAPPTAFGLGVLLLLAFSLAPLLRTDERPARVSAGWLTWAVVLGLITIPFFDFSTAGNVMGLPIGVGVACGLYGIGLALGKSEILREVFRHFRMAWFGVVLGFAAIGLMIGGWLLSSAAVVLPGFLAASCFSLHLVSMGFEKRKKLRGWEEEELEIRQMTRGLENLRKEEEIERELHKLLAEAGEEEEES